MLTEAARLCFDQPVVKRRSLAEWKRIDLLQDVLPPSLPSLADDARGTIKLNEYNVKVLRGEI